VARVVLNQGLHPDGCHVISYRVTYSLDPPK